ncbi:SRPBCC domain-containing protein [Leifsonia poae]|uniref:Activator of HSP90 ATPase n=1 Tax=Leifsonia poae TaxID=110933 RepID=A0A9W6H9N1_9MICO|nr:SRPBCC domain-containing protein [Leifsonia poae]GLJ75999.1 activator of HSP90 ATPase [Leifsonia poae]
MSAATVTRHSDGLTITRRFAAPRELVFRALSEPEHLKQWWGPPDYPVDQCSVDFRPGGVWHYSLRGRHGGEVWARSVYREIVPPERVTYVERSSDPSGAVTDDRPGAFVTITLKNDGDGTVFTARIRYQTPLDRDRAIQGGVEHGFSRALDQLDDLLIRLGAALR